MISYNLNKYIKYFTFAKTPLSLITYSYVVNNTLNLAERICACIVLRPAGDPLYDTTLTEGDHFSNSRTQFDNVLGINVKTVKLCAY